MHWNDVVSSHITLTPCSLLPHLTILWCSSLRVPMQSQESRPYTFTCSPTGMASTFIRGGRGIEGEGRVVGWGTLPPFGCQARRQSDLANEVSLHFERMGSTFTHSWGWWEEGGRGHGGTRTTYISFRTSVSTDHTLTPPSQLEEACVEGPHITMSP